MKPLLEKPLLVRISTSRMRLFFPQAKFYPAKVFIVSNRCSQPHTNSPLKLPDIPNFTSVRDVTKFKSEYLTKYIKVPSCTFYIHSNTLELTSGSRRLWVPKRVFLLLHLTLLRNPMRLIKLTKPPK